jgi:flagellar L-ring protein precursor FlgH
MRPHIFVAPALSVAVVLMLPGCGSVGRLSAVGKLPKVSAMEPQSAPPIQPSLGGQAISGRYSGGAPTDLPQGSSLFRTGAGAFFHDQRASSIGDILTVRINIADNAALDNSTTRSRTGKESAGLPNLLGLESKLNKILPGAVDPASLVNSNSTSNSAGAGNTSRSEQINTTVAAVVVGVLPNGNLVIEGKQEVRVNYELRELVVRGFVRPQDIARDNSIRSNQIAEARISYGGRGQITDLQQPRWGQQVYEALFPF